MNEWQEAFIKQGHRFQNWLHSYRMEVHFPELHQDLRLFHKKIMGEVLRVIHNKSEALGPLKYKLTVLIKLIKQTNRSGEEVEYFTRQANPTILNAFNPQAVTEKLNTELERQIEVLANWVERGSGWVVGGISKSYLDFSRYNPLRGGHYLPLPKDLQSKNAIISVKNKDNQCLRWALRAALFPANKDPQRPSKYAIDDGLDFTGISFPTPLHEIPKVERLNNIAINVLGFQNGKATILHASEVEGENIPSYKVVFITRGPVSHYCYIKNLSKLLYSQQHSESHHYHYCVRCLQGFATQAVFAKHHTLCRGASSRPTRIEMPEKGKNTLQFQNYHRQMKVPYVIYADFESIIVKHGTCIPPPERSSTTKTEVHKPSGFSLVVSLRQDNGKPQKPNHCKACACEISPKSSCMTSITIILKPNTAQTASFSPQTRIPYSSRTRPRMFTKT